MFLFGICVSFDFGWWLIVGIVCRVGFYCLEYCLLVYVLLCFDLFDWRCCWFSCLWWLVQVVCL